MRRNCAITPEKFCEALAANNRRNGFAEWYLNHALPRGWKTFRHLPSGTGKEHLLDVGGMGGLFAPAYFDLFGYGQVTVLGNDAPASGRVTIERECGPWHMPAVQCNIENQVWPFPDNTFDTVVCTEVLEHLLFDPMFAVSEMCRVLKPGGGVLITVPNTCSDECLLWLLNDMQPCSLRFYNTKVVQTGRKDVDAIANMGHFHESRDATWNACCTRRVSPSKKSGRFRRIPSTWRLSSCACCCGSSASYSRGPGGCREQTCEFSPGKRPIARWPRTPTAIRNHCIIPSADGFMCDFPAYPIPGVRPASVSIQAWTGPAVPFTSPLLPPKTQVAGAQGVRDSSRGVWGVVAVEVAKKLGGRKLVVRMGKLMVRKGAGCVIATVERWGKIRQYCYPREYPMSRLRGEGFPRRNGRGSIQDVGAVD